MGYTIWDILYGIYYMVYYYMVYGIYYMVYTIWYITIWDILYGIYYMGYTIYIHPESLHVNLSNNSHAIEHVCEYQYFDYIHDDM